MELLLDGRPEGHIETVALGSRENDIADGVVDTIIGLNQRKLLELVAGVAEERVLGVTTLHHQLVGHDRL